MRKLPQGWGEASFEEINEFSSFTIDPSKYPNETFELYSVPAFPSKVPEKLLGSEIGSTKQAVLPNDILICKINPHINRVWRVLNKGGLQQIASSEWIVMRSSKISPEYLQFYFSGPDFRDFINQELTGVGGSLTRAQPKRIATSKIPVPPFDEQRRIASKLEAVFSHLDICSERLERVSSIVGRFRQAVLTAAVSGKLTEEWRATMRYGKGTLPIKFEDDSLSIPESWEHSSINQIVEPSTPLCYGVVQPGREVEEGVPLIRIQDLDKGSIQASGLRTISSDVDEEYKRSRVQTNDILISLVGTIGRIAIVPSGLNANIARAIARLRCKTDLNPRWVRAWLSCDTVQWWLTKSAHEVARKTLNVSDLASIPIAIPPLKEQDEIVQQVERLLLYADKIDSRNNSAITQVKQIAPSLLTKAFNGELSYRGEDGISGHMVIEEIHAFKENNILRLNQIHNIKRPVMKKLSQELFLETVKKIPKDTFTFEDIKAALPGEYETLKDILYSILDKDDSGMIQVFNESTKSITFKLL